MRDLCIALAAAFYLLSCRHVSAATPEDRLTAAEIMHRSAVAENIRGPRSYSNGRLANFTENGHTWSELVLVKSPNKLLVRDSYPWLHLTVYRGFDGKRAWTSSNFGGGGLVDGASERLAKSMVAWYTSSDLIPGRWPMKLVRLPDQTIDGKSYFTIEELPEGGNPSRVWIDKRDYSSRAVSTRSDRYFKCVRRRSIRSICLGQEIISGGKVVGSIVIQPTHMKIEDVQFEMPVMLDDWTTPWLLKHYAMALGPHEFATTKLRGEMRQVVDSSAPSFTTQWMLETARPQSFVNSQSYDNRQIWRLLFDGKQGTVERLGAVTPASYAAAIIAMAYNRCELHAAECGVRVTRLADVGLDGRSFYALGVTSIQTPSLWYTLLLDRATGLPRALWLREEILYLEDYAASSSGEAIPGTWTFETTASTFRVTHVREIAPEPH